MINCWINESKDLEEGEIIEINIGIVQKFINGSKEIRVLKYNRLKKGINVRTWDYGISMIASKQKFDPPILGMVSKINTMENKTTFLLRETKKVLPPFNINGEPLTNTFISSCTEELPNERKEAINGVYSASSKPIYWEDFPAMNKPAPTVMIDYLDKCHIYLGIFGTRYSEPTEKEYRRAHELQMPTLCFVKDNMKRDEKLEKLINEFKNEQTGIVYKIFSTPRELYYSVKESIPEAIKSLFE